jgi:hypothetical protein
MYPPAAPRPAPRPPVAAPVAAPPPPPPESIRFPNQPPLPSPSPSDDPNLVPATYDDILRITAKERGIPYDLVRAIVERESSGRLGAVGTPVPSHGGAQARGLFQLMPTTAKSLGVDPNDPVQNIRGGVTLVDQLLKQTNDNVEETLLRYHGGQDPKNWGPKTKGYAADIMSTLRSGLQPGTGQAQQSSVGGPPPAPEGYQGGAGAFFSEATAGINPVNIVQGLAQALRDPRGTVKAAWNAQTELWRQADELRAQGKIGEGDRKKIYSLIPLLGPRIDQADEAFQAGEYAKGFGILTDVVGQVFGPKIIKKVGVPVLPKLVRSTLNPTEEAAIQLGLREGVPLDVATVTGSGHALKVQRVAESTYFGDIVAERIAQARAEALPQLGERLAGKVHPTAVGPFEAGQGLQTAAENVIRAHHQEANVAYSRFRALEADPQFTQQVQIGVTKSNAWTPQGTLTYTSTPVMGAMQLPVDLRVVKASFSPLLDRLKRQLTITQQEMSPGLKTLDNIVNGPDFAPLSQVDVDLGVIKRLANEGVDLPELRDISQGLSAKGVQALEHEVAQTAGRASPDIVAALQEGRAATTAKYAAKEVFDKLREEPVQAFRQTIYNKDAGINYLKELGRIAPQEMPKVGRAVLEDLFDIATKEGGFMKAQTIAGRWENLGSQTKQLLYGSHAADLDAFFLLAKRLAATPNPSSSALTMFGTGASVAAFTNPALGVPMLMLGGLTAKIMNSPRGIKLMTQGLRLQGGTAAAAVWGAEMTRLIEEEMHGEERERQERERRQRVVSPIGTPPEAPAYTPSPAEQRQMP